jgi:hypothetical protein
MECKMMKKDSKSSCEYGVGFIIFKDTNSKRHPSMPF